MKKRLLFIKLGGSIITNKEIEQTALIDIINELAQQIKEIQQHNPDLQLVIGHGQGSFAHYPAKRFRLNEGFVVENAVMGFATTLDIVAQLNRIVVAALLEHELPAVSLFPSQIALTEAGKPRKTQLDTLEAYLTLGLVPVLTGDALVDSEKGCTIWSADFSLPYFARLLRDRGWVISSVIHVTKTPGVYKDVAHPEKGTYERITPSLFAEIATQLGTAGGVDVTGGMLEKVRQAVELAEDGIETVIIGNADRDLTRLVTGGEQLGTRISS